MTNIITDIRFGILKRERHLYTNEVVRWIGKVMYHGVTSNYENYGKPGVIWTINCLCKPPRKVQEAITSWMQDHFNTPKIGLFYGYNLIKMGIFAFSRYYIKERDYFSYILFIKINSYLLNQILYNKSFIELLNNYWNAPDERSLFPTKIKNLITLSLKKDALINLKERLRRVAEIALYSYSLYQVIQFKKYNFLTLSALLFGTNYAKEIIKSPQFKSSIIYLRLRIGNESLKEIVKELLINAFNKINNIDYKKRLKEVILFALSAYCLYAGIQYAGINLSKRLLYSVIVRSCIENWESYQRGESINLNRFTLPFLMNFFRKVQLLVFQVINFGIFTYLILLKNFIFEYANGMDSPDISCQDNRMMRCFFQPEDMFKFLWQCPINSKPNATCWLQSPAKNLLDNQFGKMPLLTLNNTRKNMTELFSPVDSLLQYWNASEQVCYKEKER